jgi:hypothetical protein
MDPAATKSAAMEAGTMEPAATMEAATMEAATMEAATMAATAMTAAATRLRRHGLDHCEDSCQSGCGEAQPAPRSDTFHHFLSFTFALPPNPGAYRVMLAPTVAGRWPPNEIGFSCWPVRAAERGLDLRRASV